MHAGVIRDEERIRLKRERQEDFDMQEALRIEYLKRQSIRDTSKDGEQSSGI
jgi:protein PET117